MGNQMKGMALAFVLAVSAAVPSQAQNGNPGSMWKAPEVNAEDTPVVDDNEFLSDIGFFVDRGWTEPSWKTHERLVEDVARDLVVPDYVSRTGRPVPSHASIDIASAPITASGYNNLLVASRLPGDCGSQGCLFQIWELDGETWRKVFEFTAISFAYRDGSDGGTTDVAAVGGEDVPSRIYRWDGTSFRN